MHSAAEDVRTLLASRIGEHLERVEGKVVRLRRANSQIVTTSLGASTVATLLAGLTAAMGPLAGEGPPAWRWSCGTIAFVTAIAGFTTGLHQRFQFPDQLARALACAGRLRSLDLSLRLGRIDIDQAGHEYEEILTTYPEH